MSGKEEKKKELNEDILRMRPHFIDLDKIEAENFEHNKNVVIALRKAVLKEIGEEEMKREFVRNYLNEVCAALLEAGIKIDLEMAAAMDKKFQALNDANTKDDL